MSEQIKVLSDKDKARTKINIWHGSSSAYNKMVNELVGNSLDIFEKIKINSGIDKTNNINIKIHDNNKIEYIDDATGIPIEGIADNGMPNYKAIFEVPFAGSNYEDEVATVGTNGVFLWTLAMTCEDIEFFIARPDGNIYNIGYHKGDLAKDINVIGKSDKTYTRIIFSLDEDVWDNPNFTFEEIKSFVKGQASLSKVRITLEDLKNNLKEEYIYENGIEEYFNELVDNKDIISNNVKINKSLDYVIKTSELDAYNKSVRKEVIDNINTEIVFNFSNDSHEPIQKDYLNTADLIQHGTIQYGLILGMKNSIHKWLKENNKYDKKDKAISLEDISTSLNYICNVKSLKAKYVSQVKQETAEQHYKIVFKSIIEEFMESFFIENKTEAEKICCQILINKRSRESSEEKRKQTKNNLETNLKRKKFIPKLSDCTSKNPKECEIHIFEGDSAGGNAKQARNRRFQACLAQRGKSKNVEKDGENAVNSEVLKNIKEACNFEYGDRYREKDLRYWKIILDADGDSDGACHIVPLWLTYFYRNVPQLIVDGHLYISQPPLYKNILKNKKEYYTYSEIEQLEFLKENEVTDIQRYKGLGEMSPTQLWDTLLNPETRKLIQVRIDDFENANNTFELLMGKKVEPRREFIINYSKEKQNGK